MRRYVVSRGGLLILLAPQRYSVLPRRHLSRRVGQRREARLEVAWIGLYPDRPSRFVVAMSVLAVPATTCYLLILHVVEYGTQRPSFYVLAGVGIAVLVC